MGSVSREGGGATPKSGPVGVEVSAEHVFGLRQVVRGTVSHLSASCVVYPAGAFLVAHDTETNSQQLTPLKAGDNPTSMAVSNKK